MEIILLIGHGSPLITSSGIEHIASALHAMIHTKCDKDCVRTAYIQFNKPTIADAIKNAVMDGAKKIIVHPFFLSSGIHVTESIPKIIREAEDIYPYVKFIYTEPLGPHAKLIEIISERVRAAREKGE
ncbi:MAG: hypothetical protein HY809_11125 [Nitrospirae bacterium]|nr:hypothetical protein [Nitrospirota bacterium]